LKDIYILDTNPILDNPNIIYEFPNSLIIIPLIVLSELDKFKNEFSERGVNARNFSRILDKLYENGYKIDETNSQVKILAEEEFDKELITNLGGMENDNLIIHLADSIRHQHPDSNVQLVSSDILFKTKARGIGLSVHSLTDMENKNISDEIYNGYLEHYVSDDLIDTLYKNKIIDINDIKDIIVYPHMFIILKSFDSNKSAIAKVDRLCRVIELVNTFNEGIWGFKPKNVQQVMAFNLLLDADIPLVTLAGPAGSGKTFLPLLIGLYLTQDESLYNKVVITKPKSDMEEDPGALPGDLIEKLGPQMQSFYDNLEVIYKCDENDTELYQILPDLKLDITSVNFFRGRTLRKRFIIGDEIQNLNRLQGKTLVTRAGLGSKLILCGDIEQIDNPKVSYYTNALSHIINTFKTDDLAGHVMLPDGKARSPLADRAGKIL